MSCKIEFLKQLLTLPTSNFFQVTVQSIKYNPVDWPVSSEQNGIQYDGAHTQN